MRGTSELPQQTTTLLFCGWCKNVRLFKFSDAVMTIFSGQSVISRVYASRFGNGTARLEPRTEVVLKKYQVPGTVPSGKPPKSEPYRTVQCRTMQWKSTNREHHTWAVNHVQSGWIVLFSLLLLSKCLILAFGNISIQNRDFSIYKKSNCGKTLNSN